MAPDRVASHADQWHQAYMEAELRNVQRAKQITELESEVASLSAALEAVKAALNEIRATTEPMALLLAMHGNPSYADMLAVMQDVNRTIRAALPAGDAPRVKFEVDPLMPPGEMRVKQDGKTVLRVVGLDADKS